MDFYQYNNGTARLSSDFMAGVAKWLRHRVVVPAFVGSIPIARPILLRAP